MQCSIRHLSLSVCLLCGMYMCGSHRKGVCMCTGCWCHGSLNLGPHKVGDHLTRNKLLSFYHSREYCGFMLNTQICSCTCRLLTNQRAAFLLSGREEKAHRLLIILLIIVHKEGNSHEVRVQVFTIFSVWVYVYTLRLYSYLAYFVLEDFFEFCYWYSWVLGCVCGRLQFIIALLGVEIRMLILCMAGIWLA